MFSKCTRELTLEHVLKYVRLCVATIETAFEHPNVISVSQVSKVSEVKGPVFILETTFENL